MKVNEPANDRFTRITLSHRKEYLALLDALRKLTKKIVLVQVDGPVENDPIVQAACSMLQLESRAVVREWCGTVTKGGGAVQYTFSTTQNRREFFALLTSLDSFWEGIERIGECDAAAYYNDIAFLGDEDRVLFFSTTHERDFYLNENL